jgi:poly-gamma-glutamate capsule biosynthesis protein CapA/YwtB (metallophosphatase superfamily)
VEESEPAERIAAPATSAPGVAPAPPPAPAPPKRADELVIVAGGDVNLGRGLGQRILRDPTYDPFREIRPLFAAADLRFVNLESQLSDQGGITMAIDNPLVFTGPPSGAEVLARAGIDVVSTANNHAWDYGRRGMEETVQNLDRVGIRYAGTCTGSDGAYQPAVLRVKGWSVAIFAVTQIWNQGPFKKHRARPHVAWADIEKLREPLVRARREHDVVLVSYHGGGEYADDPVRWTRDFVDQVMALGADAVLGHHPHVPHGIGWVEGRPIFYSLGNLVFAPNEHRWTSQSFVARLRFRNGSAPRVEACPYRLVGHVPTLLTGKRDGPAREILTHHLRQLSRGLGGTDFGERDELGCMPVTPAKQKRTRDEAAQAAL